MNCFCLSWTKRNKINALSLFKKSLSLILSTLLLFQSLPLNAITKISQESLETNAEKAYDITETLFDGKTPRVPSQNPPGALSISQSDSSRGPLLLAQALDDYHRLNRCFGSGANCPSLPKSSPQIPRREQGGSPRPDPSSPRETTTPNNSKTNSSGVSSSCSFLERLLSPSYCLKLDRYLESQNPQTQISQEPQETSEEDSPRDKDYKNLSKAGKLGYWLTTILAVPALTAGFGLLGYLLSGGTAALILGFVGLALGAFATGFSYDSPGSFHEVLGNTLLSPFQIPYSILSGLLNFLSLGHLDLPDWQMSPFMSKFHKATQKASSAIALAAGASLGLGSLGVPYLASAAAFIPSPLAIGAGIYAGANVLYRGGKAIYNKIQDNKRQGQEKELETLSNEINSLHEQHKSLRRELQGLGVKELPIIKTRTPRPANNLVRNASLEERLSWNRQVKDYGQEFLKQLRDFKEETSLHHHLKQWQELEPNKQWNPTSKVTIAIEDSQEKKQTKQPFNPRELSQHILPIIPEEALLAQVNDKPLETPLPSKSEGWHNNGKPQLRITAQSGEPRQRQDGSFYIHDHVDIGVAPGTPVRSPREGVVLHDRFHGPGYGNLRAVLYEDKNAYYVFLGAHLGNYNNGQPDPSAYRGPGFGAAGATVPSGETIGISGNSGNAHGRPHLHYGLYRIPKKTKNSGLPGHQELVEKINSFKEETDLEKKIKIGAVIYGDLHDTSLTYYKKSPRLGVPRSAYTVNPLVEKNWPQIEDNP